MMTKKNATAGVLAIMKGAGAIADFELCELNGEIFVRVWPAEDRDVFVSAAAYCRSKQTRLRACCLHAEKIAQCNTCTSVCTASRCLMRSLPNQERIQDQ